MGTRTMTSTLLLMFFLGIGASFLGTLAGGGGLITLPVMLFLGIPIQTGIATNKFASGLGSFSSVLYTLRRKKASNQFYLFLIGLSLVGGAIGALVTSMLPEKLMNIVALILLVFALGLTLKKKKWANEQQQSQSMRIKGWKRFLPLGIGIYDGGFGPGSSTFAIIYFLEQGQNYIESVQLARVLNFGSCLSAFIIFYITGHFKWEVALTMAAASIIGNQVGLRVAKFISIKLARTILLSVSCLLILQIVVNMI